MYSEIFVLPNKLGLSTLPKKPISAEKKKKIATTQHIMIYGVWL